MSVRPVPSDLVQARDRLRAATDILLGNLDSGGTGAPAELEHLDLKEEPGRRGAGGTILPGDQQNPAAVEMLSRDVACMANTPGGGAIVLGVEDGTGQVIGTELDLDWLRHRVFERVEVAPAIEARRVAGRRVLVLYVAEAREPVEDPDHRIRWRVGDHCVPLDRSEWWLTKQARGGLDIMAEATSTRIDAVSPGSVSVARRYLAAGGDATSREAAEVQLPELLRRLGVLRPDGTLTQAGVLMFLPARQTLISVTRLDVPGGDVIGPPPDLTGLSLLEQVAVAEERLDAWNSARPVRRGLAEVPVRQLPVQAVREALLNAVVHRDWFQPDAITLTWIEHDFSLDSVSPGGFVGGVTAENVLTQRYARYPALSDLFRALRLVEKQGIGVDRMYRDMIVVGHRPPLIVEQAGPRVLTRLVGGDPVAPVVTLVDALLPEHRRRDVRIALIVYHLLHEPFLHLGQATHLLQSTAAEARHSVDVAAATTVRGEPLVRPYKDVWLLSPAAVGQVENAGANRTELRGRGLLTYRRPDPAGAAGVVQQWLAHHDRISTGDYATLTGLTQTGALKALDRMVREGVVERGDTAGRNAHYLPAG